jgi:cysteine desulfurase / selenocysteine lyase
VTIQELLSNEELRQREFPVTRRQVFLAHAAVAPLPRRVADAIRDYAANATLADQEELVPDGFIGQTRDLAAQLIGAESGEVALVGPTSLGLSLVATGMPWKPGDNVLVYGEDYPSNVYPWQALAARGVETRFLRTPALGLIQTEDVLRQVDARTRLVALASCHFIAGLRIDLASLGTALRERQIRFCVDAIQTLGAFPTPAEHFDFLAADAHKWLLGPCAAGILFVRRSLQTELQPSTFGWHNVLCPDFVAQPELQLRRDARRYEAGSHNLLGLVGLHASLQLLLELGLNPISTELLRKRVWLVPALVARGFEVLHPDPPTCQASAIISISRTGTDMAMLHQKLLKTGIVTSLRKDREGRSFIRISPHFYNTDAELERLLAAL